MTTTKKKTSGLWIAVGILGLFLFFSLLLNLGLFAGISAKSAGGTIPKFDGYPKDQHPRFEEHWSYGHGEAKVVHIKLNGAIMREPERGGLFPRVDIVQSVLQQIRAAANDSDVRAILMELNSPGGAVTPSDEIYAALQGFKESKPGRKVIIFTRDLAASGAYYIAMAGDYFVAEPTSIIGSVGVIMQTLNLKGLAEKIGVTDVTITAGKNKDLLNPFQPVDPAHIANLQALINDSYARFIAIVKHARPNVDRDLLDGRVYAARDALKREMIDEIGYWPSAIKATATLLAEEDVKLVRYKAPTGLAALFSQMRMPDVPSLISGQRPQMLYIWKP
ncbi:signal peptide peptidase SppA [Verrucomicrobiota bacterium]